MYFDFDDYRPDITGIGRIISWREGVLLSIIVHLAFVIFLLLIPRLFPEDPNEKRERLMALQEKLEQPKPERFVFVQPREDLKAPAPPPRAEASDQDRQARARERAPKPTNPMPCSRGNSSERVEQMDREAARGRGPEPDPSVGTQARAEPQPAPEASEAPPEKLKLPDTPGLRLPSAGAPANSRLGGGSL